MSPTARRKWSAPDDLGEDADALLAWLSSVLDGKSPRTRESYAYVVRRFFAELRARERPTSLAQIRPVHVREFFQTVRADGVSANTLANYDRTLRAIFSRLDREGRDDFDLPDTWKPPFVSVEKHRPVRVEKTPLTSEQGQALLRAMPKKGFRSARNYAQVAMMLMTGARSIEVRGATLQDVNLDARLITLRVTKGGKPRVVFLGARLTRILHHYLRRRERVVPAGCLLLFPTRTGTPQTRRALHRVVVCAGRRIGLPSLGPHRLRHSYVTLAHAKGAPLQFLKEQCGHSSVTVTTGYIALSHDQRAALAERFTSV